MGPRSLRSRAQLGGLTAIRLRFRRYVDSGIPRLHAFNRRRLPHGHGHCPSLDRHWRGPSSFGLPSFRTKEITAITIRNTDCMFLPLIERLRQNLTGDSHPRVSRAKRRFSFFAIIADPFRSPGYLQSTFLIADGVHKTQMRGAVRILSYIMPAHFVPRSITRMNGQFFSVR